MVLGRLVMVLQRRCRVRRRPSRPELCRQRISDIRQACLRLRFSVGIDSWYGAVYDVISRERLWYFLRRRVLHSRTTRSVSAAGSHLLPVDGCHRGGAPDEAILSDQALITRSRLAEEHAFSSGRRVRADISGGTSNFGYHATANKHGASNGP